MNIRINTHPILAGGLRWFSILMLMMTATSFCLAFIGLSALPLFYSGVFPDSPDLLSDVVLRWEWFSLLAMPLSNFLWSWRRLAPSAPIDERLISTCIGHGLKIHALMCAVLTVTWILTRILFGPYNFLPIITQGLAYVTTNIAINQVTFYQPNAPLRGPSVFNLKNAQKFFGSTARNALAFCGVMVARREFINAMFVGVPGSGKTLCIRVLLASDLMVSKGRPAHTCIFNDTKSDGLQIMDSIGLDLENVKTTNPFLASCQDSPALWLDVTTIGQCQTLAETLLPKVDGEHQPFFGDGARAILVGVLTCFLDAASWSLNDLVEVVKYPSVMVSLLVQRPDIWASLAHYFTNAETLASILATMHSGLSLFGPIAAAWERCPGRFSIQELIDPNTPNELLLLGSEERSHVALRAVNRFFVEAISCTVLDRPDSNEQTISIYLDELPTLNSPILPRMYKEARSAGCRLIGSTQTPALLFSTYGRGPGETILDSSTCQGYTLPLTASASDSLARSMGKTQGPGNGQQNPVMQSEWNTMGAPTPANGIPIIARHPRGTWSGVIEPEFTEAWLGEKRDEIEHLCTERKPAWHQDALPLDQADFERLGIPWPPPQAGGGELFGVRIPLT